MNKKWLWVGAISLSVFALVAFAHIGIPARAEETGDLFQINNLVVQSVSGSGNVGEINASRHNTQCTRYSSPEAKSGIKSICPLPPGASPESAVYKINVKEDSFLYLRNREKGKLSDFTSGDQINLYGFYAENGTIRALVVRNITKPIPLSDAQLNNVEVVGIAAGNPKTFVVVQDTDSSCYRPDGKQQKQITCPAGLISINAGSLSSGLTYTPEIKTRFDRVRKFEVYLTSKTIILDRNRARMDAEKIVLGDKLNVYGHFATKSNGGAIEAEVIRNLSKPKSKSILKQFDGIVVQMNASDGSFVLRSREGELVTIANPIQPNAFLNIKGTYDETTQTFFDVTQITPKKLTDASAIPILSLLDPGSGGIGTRVAMRGTGFTKTGNAVNFGSGYIPNLISDGTTLAFTVPTGLNLKCHLAVPPCLAPVELVTQGEYLVSVTNANGTSNVGKFSVSLLPPLLITTPSLPQVVEQTRYDATLEARGGTSSYNWSIARGTLPPGLELVKPVCITAPCRVPVTITGTPTIPGEYSFTISLASGNETTTKDFTIVVVRAINTTTQ